jgi:hypothetical protein
MIDFTPTPPTEEIPRTLRTALETMTEEQRDEVYRFLDSTPKADICVMDYIEELWERAT